MGFPAVGLFVPYERFKTTHLIHHHDEALTDPYDDPESNYLNPTVWNAHPLWLRSLYRFNNTLFGRVLIGPLLGMSQFYFNDLKLMIAGTLPIIRAYLLHAAGIAVAALWIMGMAHWPVWAWLLASYGALSILKIRTYLEHKADAQAHQRTAIVCDRGLLSLIFLNNNFHAVHHSHPRMPWYQLPKHYAHHKEYFDRTNNHYYYANYYQVVKQYLFQAKDPVPHPLMHNTAPTTTHNTTNERRTDS